MSQREHIIGSLLGLAIGDALGAPVEGMKAGHIRQVAGEVTDYLDTRRLWPERPSHWRLKGLYTDDTQQALALSDVLGDYGHGDPEGLADLWVRLLRADTGRPAGGHRGAGSNFIQVVRSLGDGNPPMKCGAPSAGNGAAMRIAPVGLYYHDDEAALMENALSVSLMTHTDPRGIAAAAALAIAVARLLSVGAALKPQTAADISREIQTFTRRAEERLQDDFFHLLHKDLRRSCAYCMSDALETLPPIVLERDHALARATVVKEANRLNPGQPIADANVGFAPASVTISLYYALTAPTFFHGLVDAINDGRDTDTVGAMTGALLGARFGCDAIPDKWSAGLINREQIRLRGEFLADGAVNYMIREDFVEMETRLTLEEIHALTPNIEAVRRRHNAADQKRSKSRATPANSSPEVEHLGFAPPPEVWLARDDLMPNEKRREKERRARRRFDWKETRREIHRMRQDTGDDEH
ncbi:MAG: hypothetical protein Kow0059_04110 [Candidatus Sumerlaeia bacterium]